MTPFPVPVQVEADEHLRDSMAKVIPINSEVLPEDLTLEGAAKQLQGGHLCGGNQLLP